VLRLGLSSPSARPEISSSILPLLERSEYSSLDSRGSSISWVVAIFLNSISQTAPPNLSLGKNNMASRQVLTNTLAQIAGKIATAAISIFLIKILTTYLGVDQYGLYSKIYTYLSIFSVIADLGLYTMSVREMSRHLGNPERLKVISGSIMSIRTLFGLVIIVLSLLIALALPGYNSPVALICIAITGAFTLFGLINSSIMSVLQAHLRTEFSFFSVTLGKIVGFLGVLLVVYMLFPMPTITGLITPDNDLGLIGIFVAGLLGNIIMTALLYAYTCRISPIGFAWDSEYIARLLRETLPYWVALFLGVIFFKVDIILLSLFEPLGIRNWQWNALALSWQAEHIYADRIVALYSLPMKMIEVGMMFGTVFLNSMLPLFTIALTTSEQTRAELSTLVSKAYKILLFGGVGGAVFMALESRAIISVIASPEFLVPVLGVDSSLLLSVVSSVFGLFFISSLFTYLLIASEHQSRLLKINIIVALINIVGNLLVIPYYGALGSAIVTVFSQVLLIILLVRATRDIVAFGFERFYTTGVILFAGLAGVAVWGIGQVGFTPSHPLIGLMLSGIIFGLVYIWGIFLMEYGVKKLSWFN
jgi:O-antigen/teichoic acid export membrane protein